MSNAKKGDKVRALSAYRARGFRLDAGEQVSANFSDFDQTNHDPLLIVIDEGATYVALSDADGDKIFVEGSHENQLYACIMLPGSFE